MLEYSTIKEVVEAELIEKKSKFIAFLVSVRNEEDIVNELNKVRKKYRDATHHVFAYRLESGVERCSDDGEPSGTAGIPILEILRGEDLQNVLLVVTRYFGGILLGTGGLVKAYGDSAKQVVKKAERVRMHLCTEVKIVVPYNYYSILQHYCKKRNYKIEKTDFFDHVDAYVIVPNEEIDKFTKEIADITARNAICEKVKEGYYV